MRVRPMAIKEYMKPINKPLTICWSNCSGMIAFLASAPTAGSPF
jgi:hypothetical protein